FDTERFLHWETYNPESGTAKSFLVSNIAQEVYIKKIGLSVHFDKWETINTEISQKYDDAVVHWLAEKSGLEITSFYTDDKEYFKNYNFKKKEKNPSTRKRYGTTQS